MKKMDTFRDVLMTRCMRLAKITVLSLAACTSGQEHGIASQLEITRFIGGIGVDDCDDIVVDRHGNVYLACHSTSQEIADVHTTDVPERESMDAFVIKLSPDLTQIQYASLLSGQAWDAVQALAVDVQGNVYGVGTTYSADFPANLDVFQSGFSGKSDAFIVKLDPEGQPVWITLLGGPGDEDGRDIILGNEGQIHIIGRSNSENFPAGTDLMNKQNHGENDVFVATIDASGQLVSSALIGGEGNDIGIALALGEDENLLLTGSTNSKDFPQMEAFQDQLGGESDVFISVLSSDLNELHFSSYFGGSGQERSAGISKLTTGEIMVVGQTHSPDLTVTENVHQPKLSGVSDAFLAKVDLKRKALVSASFLGGEGSDRPRKMIVDGTGRVVVVGQMSSPGFLDSVLPHSVSNKDDDAFLTIVEPSDLTPQCSWVQAGRETDVFEGIAVTLEGSLIATGLTASHDLHVPDTQISSHHGGRYDIIVSLFGSAQCDQ